MSELAPEVQAIIDEAEEFFDLDEAVDNGIVLRERSVTVYRDEVAGERFGGVEEIQSLLGSAEPRRWGLVGELDILRKTNIDGGHDEKIAALLEELEPVAEALKASALTFNLRGVPPIIVKDTRRRARKALGIASKNIPEDRMDEYVERQQAELLSDMVTSVVNAKGARAKTFEVDQALNIIRKLPTSEWEKVVAKVDEIQFQSAFAKSVTENADFSQGI